MMWKGFGTPFGNSSWTRYSIVQLETEEDKNKFFVTGGLVDGGFSRKAFIFDAMVQ